MSRKVYITNDYPIARSKYDKNFMKKESEVFLENSDLTISRVERIILRADHSFKSINTWDNFIQNYFPPEKQSINHNTAIIFPKNIDIINEINDIKNVPFYSIKEKINYQEANEYLDFISNQDERNLPCFYTSFRNSTNRDLMEMSSFNERIMLTKDVFEHFHTSYANQFKVKAPAETTKMSNILFGSNFNFSINHYKKKIFPINVEINFSTIKNDKFRPILDEMKLYESFVNDYIFSDKNALTFEVAIEDNTPIRRDFNIVDLNTIIKDLSYTMDDSDKILLSSDMEKENYFSRNIKKLACMGKIRNLAKEKTRSFMDIASGQECEYEFLFFRVEKHIGNRIGNTPISSFWCSSKEEMVNIIDTQVKANQRYTYFVKGYCLIYGSSYKVLQNDVYSQGENLFCRLDIETRPSFQIVEIPLFRKSVSFAMSPPMPPFVHFTNENNSSNRIKIYLDLKRGEMDRPFIPLTRDDEDRLNRMKPIDSRVDIFNFRYTNEAGNFQIFKTSTKPKNYGSFEVIDPDNLFNEFNSTSMVYYDYVLPNKKYYYIFRAYSGSDLVSNPTPIYEVELIKDSDESKVVVNIINPIEMETDDKSVKLRRLLKIAPAPQHTIYEEPLAAGGYGINDVDNVTLGVADDPIWGKKFKIRIKSKDSGKKIDFNILFNLVKSKSTEDFWYQSIYRYMIMLGDT